MNENERQRNKVWGLTTNIKLQNDFVQFLEAALKFGVDIK